MIKERKHKQNENKLIRESLPKSKLEQLFTLSFACGYAQIMF